MKSVQGQNAQDDLDSILFGNQDASTPKSTSFSMNDNTSGSKVNFFNRFY